MIPAPVHHCIPQPVVLCVLQAKEEGLGCAKIIFGEHQSLVVRNAVLDWIIGDDALHAELERQSDILQCPDKVVLKFESFRLIGHVYCSEVSCLAIG